MENTNILWEDVIKKEARGFDDDGDLGEVKSVEGDHIFTRAGITEKITYSLPNVNDNNDIRNQEELLTLTLDTISPIWGKKLEESKLLPLLSLRRLKLYLELKRTAKCVVGEAYGFSSSYVHNCKLCSKIAWKFMFYFMIHSYSKLERTKNEFVKHWGEMNHYTSSFYGIYC